MAGFRVRCPRSDRRGTCTRREAGRGTRTRGTSEVALVHAPGMGDEVVNPPEVDDGGPAQPKKQPIALSPGGSGPDRTCRHGRSHPDKTGRAWTDDGTGIPACPLIHRLRPGRTPIGIRGRNATFAMVRGKRSLQ